MKEADIGDDDEDDEDLVQILQQSLLYMKEEKELMKDFLPIDYFTSDLSDIENSTVFDINMISFDDFCKIDQKLRNGEISIRALCKQFRCGHSQIKKIYKKFNLQYPDLSAGKKCQPLSEEIAQKVHDYLQRFKVGYQRMTSTLKRMGYSNVTEYQVRNLYEKEGYYLYEKEYKPKSDHNNRFEAPFANQLWHTDLHYFKENDSDEKWKYLIAFIDDRTRKILYFELLDDKSAISVSAALQKALSVVIEERSPHTIVTDNGKEFVNEEFSNILNCFGVRHNRTHPYTPEENAKIHTHTQRYESFAFHAALSPALH